LETDAAAHQKHGVSLPPEKKAQFLHTDAAAHQSQCHQHLTEEERKIAAQIKSVAAILYETIDLDQPTIEFLTNHVSKDSTLALAYCHCCFINQRAAISNDELGSDIGTSAMWGRISNLIGDPIGQLYSINKHSRISINHTPKLLLVHLVVSAY
jgi:hypothetical protein